MIRYKLLAASISAFVIFSEGFSRLKAEGTETKKLELIDSKNKLGSYSTANSSSTSEVFTVSASVYFPEEEQTDDTPFVTADGSLINEKNPRKHHWIAVSRELLDRWGGNIHYGDSVMVKGISDELDGIYVVRDTMNRRIKNRIDILVGRHDNIYGLWENIKVYKLN